MKRFALLFICLLVIIITAFNKSADPYRELYEKAADVREKYPFEKVYLQLDKPYFSTADSIWFKAYVVVAGKNLPSGISQLLYAELVDQNDSVNAWCRLPVSDGIAAGYLPLPDSLQEGNYRLRAYTQWMRNFGEDCFFEQPVAIGDALNSDVSMRAELVTDDEKKGASNGIVLQYHYFNGHPARDKITHFSVFADNKEIASGNGKTDDAGSMRISLNKFAKNNNTHYRLVTQVKENAKKTITKTATFGATATAVYKVYFFPEGGQLVNGFYCKLGFKAVNQYGEGVHITGNIFSNDAAQLTTFESGFGGMGNCGLLAENGKGYYAMVRFDDGSEKKVELPVVADKGYTLSVQSADTDLLHIRMAGNMMMDEELTLVVQSGNRIEYIAASKAGTNGTYTTLSKKRFPTGIAQLTLFNATMQPVAERLVFINNNDQLAVQLVSEKPAYSKREKVLLKLKVKDPDGDIIKGSFSMAVTHQAMVPVNEEKNASLMSALLLTGDIKGYIEDPGHYFSADNKRVRTELDNLLLTQGWRKFSWKDILQNRLPVLSFNAEKTLTISGTAISAKGEPLGGRKVVLLLKDGSNFTKDAVTNAQGRFLFDSLYFTGDVEFALVTADAKGTNDARFVIDSFSHPSTGNLAGAARIRSDAHGLFTYLDNANRRYTAMKKFGQIDDKGKTLQEVFVNARKKTRIDEAVAPSDNLNGPGKADQVLTYENLRDCANLGMCLISKLRGITFKLVYDSANLRKDMVPFSIRGGADRPMLVLFDGIEMDTKMGGQSLSTLAPSTIQSIEVLQSASYLAAYGTRAAGGVIIITSKRGGIDYDAGKAPDKKEKIKGAVFGNAKGYPQMREFYSPDYSSPVANKNMPDLRSTIFWTPNLVINDDGEAAASFYTADVPGQYRVIVEGIADNGKLGRQVYSFIVQ